MQFAGMREELPVEIEYVAVRVALAQNGNEAKDIPLEAEAFAISLDQRFAGQFGSRIERSLHREGGILGRGNDGCLAVNRSGGGEGNSSYAGGTHGLEHVTGSDRVLLQVLRGCSVPKRTSALAAR